MVDLDAMKKLFFVVFLIICSANAQVPTIGWQKTIGGSLSDDITIVKKTPDGYILGASFNSDISGEKSENSKGDSDYWIVKVNGVGEIEWQQNYNSLETIKIDFPFPKGIYVVRCQSGTTKSQIIKIIK